MTLKECSASAERLLSYAYNRDTTISFILIGKHYLPRYRIFFFINSEGEFTQYCIEYSFNKEKKRFSNLTDTYFDSINSKYLLKNSKKWYPFKDSFYESFMKDVFSDTFCYDKVEHSIQNLNISCIKKLV